MKPDLEEAQLEALLGGEGEEGPAEDGRSGELIHQRHGLGDSPRDRLEGILVLIPDHSSRWFTWFFTTVCLGSLAKPSWLKGLAAVGLNRRSEVRALLGVFGKGQARRRWTWLLPLPWW